MKVPQVPTQHHMIRKAPNLEQPWSRNGGIGQGGVAQKQINKKINDVNSSSREQLHIANPQMGYDWNQKKANFTQNHLLRANRSSV